MSQSKSLSLDELRSFVLEAFKKDSSTQYLTICSGVASILVNKNIVSLQNSVFSSQPSLSMYDQDRVREIIWDLIIERIVTIGINSSNAEWPFLKLTEYGKQVVNSSMPIPHDPSGYLTRLKADVPDVDDIIIAYLEESLRTYNVGALLASTITLGCAAEKALLLLIETYGNAIQDNGSKIKYMQDTQGKMIKRQFETFEKNLSKHKGNLPGDIKEGLDVILLGIFEMIRTYRNDAGHPTGKTIPREQVYANLQVFIPYCKKVYQLKDYFEKNSV